MYLPRSLAGMRHQVLSYARRAAFAATSTSSAVACATSDSFFSLAGLIVSKYFPRAGGVNRPSMNRSYRGSIFAWDGLSGAGAYVQSVLKFSFTSGAAWLIAADCTTFD